MAPLKVIKGQRSRQYVAGGMLDSVRYKTDFGVMSLGGHALVEAIEEFRVTRELQAQV